MTDDNTYQRTVKQYVYGGFLAAIVTGVVYFVAVDEWLTGMALAFFALAAAAVQLAIHLAFFVHVRDREGPNWAAMSFLFTALTALIIIIGSIWIMMNVNYNMGMSPEKMDEYMIKQGKKGF
jgi:cytochrome o ubiquinol oxidase operon protein cyoD